MTESVADIAKLAAWWDEAANGMPASEVLVKSHRAAKWKCTKGHSFTRSPRALSRKTECPTCAKAGKSLADTHAELLKQWHPSKNAPLKPTAIDAAHTAKVWWVCLDEGHAFERTPLEMVSDAACPICALQLDSLAALFPEIAAEWHPTKNGKVRADQVEPDHKMTAHWVCSKGHEFSATVRSRTRNHGRCPQCFGAWSVDAIRAFVKSLLEHIGAFDPGEMFALAMQAGALRGKSSRAFVMALTTGRFPVEELEKFADNKPSLVDEFAGNAELTLAIQEAEESVEVALEESDELALPEAPDALYQDDGDIDVSKLVSEDDDEEGAVASEDGALPVVQTKDALSALDSPFIANADQETVRFLLDSAKAKLWKHAYSDPEQAETQAREFEGDTYSTIVRDRFLSELDAANSMKLPKGYAFRPTPQHDVCEPHLMQKHVAVSVANQRRFGNWSGMGAGKTLSAVLATRLTGSKLTVICCPNAVVSNWAKEVENAFPGCQIQTKTWTPEWNDSSKPRYLIMNFEQFQLESSETNLLDFIEQQRQVDFIVIDEIHFAKQRHAKSMSRRKRLVAGLVVKAIERNEKVCVLGMSGTPVINELQEGKSLVEMITGYRHDEIETKATVQNCMRLYQKFVTLGTRWKPNYKAQLEVIKPDVDCVDRLDEIRAIARGSTLDMEKALTKIRIPTIIDHLEPGKKTIIYSHYVDGIAGRLRDAVKAAGYRPGLFTGKTDDSDLEEFKKPKGSVDVLIASSRVSTGVDGLQHVCNKLIINALPWTNAEYEQLCARVWRQGTKFEKVTVVIPVTFAYVNGERWSYCESKLHRLEYKKSISDAAVDGVVPEGNLRTESQAQQDIMSWLERLENGVMETIERYKIEVPLSRSPDAVKKRVRKYGDFTAMNNRWYATHSQKTHQRLKANPEEWAHYHTMYQELRKSWDVVPYEEEIAWLKKRPAMDVGDFGCGEALIHAAVGDLHRMRNFDHIAINEHVEAEDLAALPLDDDCLDLAIFCLSLMGSNFTQYIREAHRCLKLDGELHIWEPASKFDDPKRFRADLEKLGFDLYAPKKQGQFLQIRGQKNANKPDKDLQLRFRA